MTLRLRAGGRSGITLTEILISIMIMGVGLISLATLFPLGLTRLREAQRYTRSTLLAETATNDAGARNLMTLNSFTYSWYANWLPLTPFKYDPPPGLPRGSVTNPVGATVPVGPGLPVAYDPIWWAVVHQNTFVTPQPTVIRPDLAEARFAVGLGFLRPDPTDGLAASAQGLQRITNFQPVLGWPLTYPIPNSPLAGLPDVAGDIFTSRDDIVFQSDDTPKIDPATSKQFSGSPLVPDLSTGAMMNDWTYTWMFTGRQSDVNDPSMFDGDIVVFHNRPFGIEAVTSPFTGQPVAMAQGERVVEGIFGVGGSKNVLLRWPASMPDPDIRVGSWIADVTYERYAANVARYVVPPFSPAQRCYWYQVAKKTPPKTSVFQTDPAGVAFREMALTVASPVRSRTPINPSTGEPAHINAALVNPWVVNVFPKIIYVR